MKRAVTFALTILMVTMVFVGCATKKPDTKEHKADTTEYKDGEYFAISDDFDDKGFKYFTSFKVTDGKINNVVFDCVNQNAKTTKVEMVKAGQYSMVEQGQAQAEWDEQAQKAADYLVETQDPSGVEFKEDGKTDAIAGVSISVSTFFELAKKALSEGPTEKGPFADGVKHAETEFDDNGWKYFVDIYVLNGEIQAVNWDGVNKDGESKKALSEAGEYGMVKQGNAQDEWHVQAQKAEQYLIHKQNPDEIQIGDGGKTDAIAGVSITISDFVKLAKEALGK